VRSRAPIYEALLKYRAENNTLLHMPGHVGGRGFTIEELRTMGTLDFTEVPGLDDLHSPSGPIQEARELMAQAFGARESFFLVNGATSGIQAVFLAVAGEGEPVLVPRNAHRSFYAGLVLSGAMPVYYSGRLMRPWGLVLAVEPEDIAAAMEQCSDAVAVFLVSPTYYGTTADVGEIVRLMAAYGKMVLVDEAHGAHFGFHPRLPAPALLQGAAAVVHGMHKSLPVMTQGAALHIGPGFKPVVRLRNAYHLLTTTSPSYPLLASMDLARCLMVEEGTERLESVLHLADRYRAKIRVIPGLECPGEEMLQAAGVKGYDPLKVLVRVTGLSLTGYQTADLLREQYRIQVEMAGEDFILAMFSPGHQEEDWGGFYHALRDISYRYVGTAPGKRLAVSVPPYPRVEITPRQAYFSPMRRMHLSEVAGQLSAEMVTSYPPGIPCLLPGELITSEMIDYLYSLRASGCRVQGPDDPSLEYLYVIDNAAD
jgi:arginine decarboxylase